MLSALLEKTMTAKRSSARINSLSSSGMSTLSLLRDVVDGLATNGTVGVKEDTACLGGLYLHCSSKVYCWLPCSVLHFRCERI